MKNGEKLSTKLKKFFTKQLIYISYQLILQGVKYAYPSGKGRFFYKICINGGWLKRKMCREKKQQNVGFSHMSVHIRNEAIVLFGFVVGTPTRGFWVSHNYQGKISEGRGSEGCRLIWYGESVKGKSVNLFKCLPWKVPINLKIQVVFCLSN